jgi:TRAP-type C4-dicarboxylate transport system substrate-binding protein
VYTMRHDEVARYYSLNEHMMIPDVLVMNLDRWNSLSDAHKAAIERASAEAKQVAIDAWIVQEEEALASISKNMIVNRIENKQPFIDLLAPMHEKADQQFGGLVSRIVEHP